MAEPASRAELDKLARELGVPESELGFLEEHAPDALRELRRLTSAALTRRHESRVRTLASMSRMLPVGVAAKIAENALGPALSARVAAAMPTEDAARLVGDLSPEFLTELAARLDPERARPLLATLPTELVADVARRLLANRDLIALARFVSVVDRHVVSQIAAEASEEDLRQVALYTEDPAALARLGLV
jgi:hypothetical protein